MKKSILVALAAVALVSIPAVCASSATTKGAKTAQHDIWAPETLSGKITMVDPALHVVVVRDSSGVPFDMVVSRSTRIQSANGPLKLQDLNADLNRGVSVRFVPEGRGDVARTIHVQ